MKKVITRSGLMILMLLFSTFTFAQGEFGDPSDLDPLDEPAAPISDYIWVLAVIGLVYVFYKMRNRIQTAN